MVVGYPQSGVQLFKDFNADYGDDAADILVTDGLQDGELPSNVGDDMSNVRGTAPSAAGPGVDTSQSSSRPSSITKRPACLRHRPRRDGGPDTRDVVAGESDGQAVRDHMRVVANPGGESYGPSELPAAVEAAAAGENIRRRGSVRSTSTKTGIGVGAVPGLRVAGRWGCRTQHRRLQRRQRHAAAGIDRSGSDSATDDQVGGYARNRATWAARQPIRDGALLPALQLEGDVVLGLGDQVGDTRRRRRRVSTRPLRVSAGYPSITGAGRSASIQVAGNELSIAASSLSPASMLLNYVAETFTCRIAPATRCRDRSWRKSAWANSVRRPHRRCT